MPRRNRNAHAPAPDTDELADQAGRLATELTRTDITEEVTGYDHD